MKKFVRDCLCWFGRFYYRFRLYEPIYLYVLNRRGRTLYKQSGVLLSKEESSVSNQIREDGIAVSHVDYLGLTDFFSLIKAESDRRLMDAHFNDQLKSRDNYLVGDKIKSKDYFLVNLLEKDQVINLKNDFIRLSLSTQVLNIVNSYLQLLAKFRGSDLKATIPMPEGSRHYASQQWHRDPEDKRLVKVFLYINDVDESTGPFHYLKYSHDGGKWRNIFPLQPPSGTAKMPPDADDMIPHQDVLSCVGKAGTLIFCDTSGLHKGGYSMEKTRVMYTSTFTSEASVCPIRYSYAPDFSLNGLSHQAAYALQNDPNQKEPKYY